MYTENSTLKFLVNKIVLAGRICRWLLLFQEYDFEVVVKPIWLNVGPDHLSHIKTGEEPTNLEEGLPHAHLFAVPVVDGHFEDIIHFLTIGTAPEGYTVQQRKELVVRTTNFSVIVGNMYKMGSNEILRWYVPEFERSSILTDSHGGTARGNYAGRATAQNIIRTGLWWPTLHQDSKAYCKACDACQRTGRPSWMDDITLNPQMAWQPFEKWAIDFVAPIIPQAKTGARYIINAMEYLTHWAKV